MGVMSQVDGPMVPCLISNIKNSEVGTMPCSLTICMAFSYVLGHTVLFSWTEHWVWV